MNRLIIFDRDGTLVKAMLRGEYLLEIGQLELLPGAVELVRMAKELDYMIAVATNQPQVAKGLLSPANLQLIHEEMVSRFGGAIDRIYHCPHRNEDGCRCRKPKPGMLLQAMEEFGVRPTETIMIGDTDRDVLAGQSAGCRTIFLRDDQNAGDLELCQPDHVVHHLSEIHSLL